MEVMTDRMAWKLMDLFMFQEVMGREVLCALQWQMWRLCGSGGCVVVDIGYRMVGLEVSVRVHSKFKVGYWQEGCSWVNMQWIWGY